MFGCERSFSSHIEKKKSKCDYHFDRSLNNLEELELVKQVNEVINLNLDVKEQFLTLAEAAEKYNLRMLKIAPKLAFSSWFPPLAKTESYASGLNCRNKNSRDVLQ
jgi:Ser-tRNA(Ala) deacylase AlaX